jgi:hypothetical protein
MRIAHYKLDFVLSLPMDGRSHQGVLRQVQQAGGAHRMRLHPRAACAPLPSGRGREAMTYGRVCRGKHKRYMERAAEFHLA